MPLPQHAALGGARPPAGGSTHRLIEAPVEELLVPLLDLRPGPIPQLPLLAPRAIQEFLGLALIHCHFSLSRSRC